MSRPRRFPGWLLAVIFFGVPLLEILVLIRVGQAIGAWWTILLLILDSLVGAWLIRHEGARAFRALSVALSSGRMPARELADGILVLAGGLMMLSPGFVLDIVGMVLILPVTRPIGRRLLTRVVSSRLLAGGYVGPGAPGFGQRDPGRNEGRPRPGSQGPVVEGEVVDPPDGPSDV
ncbi:MAG: FxsA family protein [Nocardioides sp.]